MSHNKTDCWFIFPFNNVIKIELIIKLENFPIYSLVVQPIEPIIKSNSNR